MGEETERRNYKLFGEAHPNAKLTREQVVQIRKEIRVPGTSRAWLAKRHSVSRTTVDNIVRGITPANNRMANRKLTNGPASTMADRCISVL